MPIGFGFRVMGAGVGSANLGHTFITMGSVDAERMWSIWSTGGEGTYMGELALSAERFGTRIPMTDSAGRHLPVLLNNKTVNLEIASGMSWRGRHGIKIQIRSASGLQEVEYEWEGRIPITKISPSKLEVSGTARRCMLDESNNRDVFNSIMGTD